jgi:hypothetical protein
VCLAVLAEERAVASDHGGGVVEDFPALRFPVLNFPDLNFIDGNDQRDAKLPGQLHHELHGGAVGDALGEVVPSRGLLGAEVRAVEDLLQADDLRPIGHRRANHRDVLFYHRLLDCGQRRARAVDVHGDYILRLDQRTSNDSRHGSPSPPAS